MAPRNKRRILVGTDFSPSAEIAVRRGGAVAQECDGVLEIIHVLSRGDTPVYRVTGWAENRRAVEAEAMRKLRGLASRARARFGISVHPELVRGSPQREIAAYAASIGASLVVVGPNGDHAVRDMLIGSTAQRLQRALRVPLLIARNRLVRAYRRVLVTTDFSRASAEAARTAATLFPRAELHFVHACNVWFATRASRAGPGRAEIAAHRKQILLDAESDLDDFIRTLGLQGAAASALVKEGDPAARIVEAASEVRASIVTFGTKGKSRIEARLIGSVSGELLRQTRYDVLLTKPPVGKTRRRS